MTLYRRLIFPLLCQFDAEKIHDTTLRLLSLSSKSAIGRGLIDLIAGEIPHRPVEAFGLSFPNELGVAAGFDKNVQTPIELGLLGFGHVEVGTLTPRQQHGNTRPRIFRIPSDKAIINRMGFPNIGSAEAASRLKRVVQKKGDLVIGVSLGKQKETPLPDAVDDYVKVMRDVYSSADYLVINVSSPNTPDLRKLQHDYLESLLARLGAENKKMAEHYGVHERPLLLKIAPDLAWSDLDQILATAHDESISGIIATNTTLNKNGLDPINSRIAGGLSGSPLFARSNEIISYIFRQSNGSMPVIGVGGVFNCEDVKAKLDSGAVLVQVYTGLVYEGPAIAGRVLRDLKRGHF